MARYKFNLVYDGTGFGGSQRQARRRTVQAELESALRSIGWTGRAVTLAGRTDSGVHASGQVAAGDLEWVHGPERLRDALNANLPPDLAVRSVERVADSFHPRFEAVSRRYQYCLYCDPIRDPLRDGRAWRIWPEVEPEVLAETAQVLLGRHDFAAFGSPPREEASTFRTVSLSEWKKVDEKWHYQIRADAFLYRMVRRLVYVQVAVAQGRSSKEMVIGALETPRLKNRIPAGLAPAHGLTLVEVTY